MLTNKRILDELGQLWHDSKHSSSYSLRKYHIVNFVDLVIVSEWIYFDNNLRMIKGNAHLIASMSGTLMLI